MARPVHGGNLNWAAALARCSPSAILDFSASINPLGPPQSAIEAIQTHLADLRDYPDPDYGQVRSTLAQIHQLPPDWILPGNGSAELLTWACWDLAKLEATYLITPAFGDYFRALRAFDAKVVRCPFDFDREWGEKKREWALGSREWGEEVFFCPSEGCGLLLNNPHNPTGKLFAREAILPLLEQFELVVVDEAFMDFLTPDRQQSLIDCVQDYPNLVILRSLTKFYSLPGLRFGYAIAHPDRLQQWQQRRDPWSVNVLAAAAAEAILKDEEFQKQTYDWLAVAHTALFDGLSQVEGLSPCPSVANFFLVKSDQPSSQLQRKLLHQHKILIRDCLSFPELGDRYFRVAVRLASENQRMIDGLTEVLSSA